VEESVKGLAILLLFLVFRHEFDGILDGIVYGALVGFGFAMTENGLYFLGAIAEGGTGVWVTVVFFRTLVFGLNHGLFSAIVGTGFGYAATATNACARWAAPPVALILAIVVHSVHNVSMAFAGSMGWPVLISLVNNWGGVAVLLVVVLLSWNRERAWIIRELETEVQAGLLTPVEYLTVASYGRRVGAQLGALSRHGLEEARRVRKFHQRAADLAFAKRKLRVSPDDLALERTVDRLRGDLAAFAKDVSPS
jgi:hypothetical protein